jgi:Muconolactone delta-isomerase
MALYLAIGEYVEPGPLLPPQQVVQMIEQVVLPSFEAMAKLQDQKKIVAGGIYAGDRKGCFILDVASNDEVNRILQALPFWGLLRWTVVPMQGFRERAADERKAAETMKGMIK